MKTFIVSLILVVLISIGAAYGLDYFYGGPVEKVYISDNVRLD